MDLKDHKHPRLLFEGHVRCRGHLARIHRDYGSQLPFSLPGVQSAAGLQVFP